MSDKFTRREIKEILDGIDDIPVGKQINIHHCRQGKGNDRLYIKRLNHGSILFCHHCGKSGFIFGGGVPAKFLQKEAECLVSHGNVGSSQRSMARLHSGQEGSEEHGKGGDGRTSEGISLSLPRDASRNIRGWSSPHPKLWLTRHGIKVDTLKDFEIYWSEKMGALIFPQRNLGELVGYQYRYFPPKPDTPKYLTKTKVGFNRKNNHLDVIYPYSIPVEARKIILVEDYISAIRVSSLGYNVCPLWGSQLHDGQLKYLLQNYNEFVIMLDNDNSQVKKKQRRIRDRLEAHGTKVKLYLLDKDPKEYSDEELNNLLIGNLNEY